MTQHSKQTLAKFERVQALLKAVDAEIDGSTNLATVLATELFPNKAIISLSGIFLGAKGHRLIVDSRTLQQHATEELAQLRDMSLNLFEQLEREPPQTLSRASPVASSAPSATTTAQTDELNQWTPEKQPDWDSLKNLNRLETLFDLLETRNLANNPATQRNPNNPATTKNNPTPTKTAQLLAIPQNNQGSSQQNQPNLTQNETTPENHTRFPTHQNQHNSSVYPTQTKSLPEPVFPDAAHMVQSKLAEVLGELSEFAGSYKRNLASLVFKQAMKDITPENTERLAKLLKAMGEGIKTQISNNPRRNPEDAFYGPMQAIAEEAVMEEIERLYPSQAEEIIMNRGMRGLD